MNEIDEFPTLPTAPESPQQAALYGWFAEQQLKSVDNLETAARQIITLCTTLLGLLLGLMALTKTPLPAHMQWSGIQWLSGVGVAALLAALLCALAVVTPQRTPVTLNEPDSLQQAFDALLARKNKGLWLAILFFAVGMLCLALAVLISLALLS